MLHHQVEVLWRLIGLVVLDHVGMVERSQDKDLLPQLIDSTCYVVLFYNFDGYFQIGIRLADCQKHLPEVAGAELRLGQLVLCLHVVVVHRHSHCT